MLEAILLYFMYELMREAGRAYQNRSAALSASWAVLSSARPPFPQGSSAHRRSSSSLSRSLPGTRFRNYTSPWLYCVLFLFWWAVYGVCGACLQALRFYYSSLLQNKLFRAIFGPVAPFRLSAMRDVLVRAGWKRLVRHNASVQHMPGAGKGEKHL